jgi:hypothetical protein
MQRVQVTAIDRAGEASAAANDRIGGGTTR